MKLKFKTINDLLNIEEKGLLDFINTPFYFQLTKEEEDYLISIRDFIAKNIHEVHNFGSDFNEKVKSDIIFNKRVRRHMIRTELIYFCYWKRRCCHNPERYYLLEERKNNIIDCFNRINKSKQI